MRFKVCFGVGIIILVQIIVWVKTEGRNIFVPVNFKGQDYVYVKDSLKTNPVCVRESQFHEVCS